MDRIARELGGLLPRRGFLTRAAGVLAGAAVAGVAGRAGAQVGRGGGSAAPWLERLDGEHGQIFDAAGLAGGKVLQQARNFLDAYREAFGVSSDRLDVVVGAHGGGLPIVFGDEVWARFRFGERFEIRDPGTREAATRNVYARGPDPAVPANATVEALQREGVIFLLCNNSLKRITGTFSQAGFGTPEEVREELVAGLLPDVEVVPAMVVAMNQAQEKGLSYVYAG